MKRVRYVGIGTLAGATLVILLGAAISLIFNTGAAQPPATAVPAPTLTTSLLTPSPGSNDQSILEFVLKQATLEASGTHCVLDVVVYEMPRSDVYVIAEGQGAASYCDYALHYLHQGDLPRYLVPGHGETAPSDVPVRCSRTPQARLVVQVLSSSALGGELVCDNLP